jgi:hypothetical protein
VNFFFKFLRVCWDWVHLVGQPLTGLLYQSRMINDECGAVGGIRLGRGNRSTRRKPALSDTLPTTNATWTEMVSNPCRRGGKPATNRLSYGTAYELCYSLTMKSLLTIFWHKLTLHLGSREVMSKYGHCFKSEVGGIGQLQSRYNVVEWADVLMMMDRNLAWFFLTSLRECTTYQDPGVVSEGGQRL